MKFEKTTKTNKHGITNKQHFHMEAVIKRFRNGRFVRVYDKNGKVLGDKAPGAKVFYALRSWSQEAERDISWPIEAAFINQVSLVEAGAKDLDNSVISDYFLLWNIRYHYAFNPADDFTLYENLENSSFSCEDEEYIESKGGVPVRQGGVVPSRFVTTIQIRKNIEENRKNLNNIRWQILDSSGERFLSADCYMKKAILPINPNTVLVGRNGDFQRDEISNELVKKLNEQAAKSATRFYFGVPM